MGILGDINEAKMFWSKSALITKLFIIISTFLTFSSVTSLSEVIFKWRGFISDGLTFYREHILEVIRQIGELLNLSYTNSEIDVLVLFGIIVGSFIRTEYDNDRIPKIILMLLLIIYLDTVYDNGKSPKEDLTPYWRILIYALIPLVGNLVTYFSTKDQEKKKYLIKKTMIFYTPILLAIVSVLILAAVNTGLSTPI